MGSKWQPGDPILDKRFTGAATTPPWVQAKIDQQQQQEQQQTNVVGPLQTQANDLIANLGPQATDLSTELQQVAQQQFAVGEQTAAQMDPLIQQALQNAAANPLDPEGQFGQLAQTQLGNLQAQLGQQQQQSQQAFGRRGLGFSAAAQNQQNQLATAGQGAQNQLLAQLGVQGLGYQTQQAQLASGLLGQTQGQQIGALEAGGGTQVAGFETSTIPAQLSIANLAAQLAGQPQGGGGK
jgi:hypothetical protein